jgi:hypothetical protein
MDLIERRTLLRGALILPAAAAAPLAVASASAPPPESPPKRTQRIRTWQVESLDRRVNPR